MICWAVSGSLPDPIQDNTDLKDTGIIFCKEAIGTFVYVVIYLILVSSDTTFVEMEIQVWFTIPLILVTVCEMIKLPLATNPAWGLSFNVVYGIHYQNFVFMQNSWSIFVGPIVGSILAAFFF